MIKSIGVRDTFETIITGNINKFLLACSMIPLFLCLKVLKWHLMIRDAGAKEDFSTSIKAVLFGLGFGIFTPARAGEIMRVSCYSSINKIMTGGLVVVDRLIDLITILLLGTYFVLQHFGFFYASNLFLLNIILLLILGRALNIHKYFPSKHKDTKFYRFIEKIGEGSKILTTRNLVIYSGISILNWMLVILQFYLLLNMYYFSTINVAISSLPIIQLSNLIPVTIAGIGLRENLSIYILQIYAIPNQVAALSAFILYFIDIFIPGLIGLLVFGLRRSIK